MTFVAARRFGDRIVIAADTMISDDQDARHDVIPGRLKAVVLNSRMSVAYAGRPNQAIDAIRAAKRCLDAGGSEAGAEQILVAATLEHFGHLEFVLASHVAGASLKRIWEGRISFGLESVSIGQRSLDGRLANAEKSSALPVVPHEHEAESAFTSAFRQLFDGVFVSEGVGGFGFLLLGSPYGHCYQPHAAVTNWDQVDLSTGLTDRHLADHRSGMTQWSFHTQGARLRGVGVAGAAILDAGIGYIYSPLERDAPFEWRFEPPVPTNHGATLQAFQRQIDAVADRVGGGVADEPPPDPSIPPSPAQFAEVEAYAASRSVPTTVTLRNEGVWVQCGDAQAHQGALVAFRALGTDPVQVLRTTIERMNAGIVARTGGP
jgi:hypothetical protein